MSYLNLYTCTHCTCTHCKPPKRLCTAHTQLHLPPALSCPADAPSPDGGDLLHHISRGVQVDEALVDPAVGHTRQVTAQQCAGRCSRRVMQGPRAQHDALCSCLPSSLAAARCGCPMLARSVAKSCPHAPTRCCCGCCYPTPPRRSRHSSCLTSSRSGPRCWYPHRKETCGW
jgi:hypothetical protein